MKRLIAFIITFVCLFWLVGCSAQKEYAIRVVVPAGSQGEFVYSDEEISPRKSRLEIKSIDMSEDAEFVLKPIDETQENAYECTNFPKGEPMLIDGEKGAWYKIGVAMENPTDEDIVVVFHVVNVKVRIK
jgi:hypothetical protein